MCVIDRKGTEPSVSPVLYFFQKDLNKSLIVCAGLDPDLDLITTSDPATAIYLDVNAHIAMSVEIT